jgi:alpha-beta hydrolase superfamily lysophospholipase
VRKSVVSAPVCGATGKVEFTSKARAKAAASFLAKQRSGERQYAYRCTACLCWHLTRMSAESRACMKDKLRARGGSLPRPRPAG